MSEETKQVEATENQQPQATETKPEETQAKQMTFTQEQLDNIIKGRIESEKRKYDRILEEQNKAKEEAIKQKQIEWIYLSMCLFIAKYRITVCSVETHIHFLVPPHSFSYIYIY